MEELVRSTLRIGGAGFREGEGDELGGFALMRFSRQGFEPKDSSVRLKSSRSCWDNVSGEGERRRFLVDWAS